MKKPRKTPEKKKPLAVKPAAPGPAAGAAVPPDDFQRRLAARREELKWLYCELYHNDRAAFDYFVGMLRRCWQARKPALRAQDARRAADPGWYRRRDLLGMMLYVKAFAGDLNGVRRRLAYLRECGVNYLHLMPLLESPKNRSDGGYAVSDFRRVQPDLGTMEDLEEQIGRAHV